MITDTDRVKELKKIINQHYDNPKLKNDDMRVVLGLEPLNTYRQGSPYRIYMPRAGKSISTQ